MVANFPEVVAAKLYGEALISANKIPAKPLPFEIESTDISQLVIVLYFASLSICTPIPEMIFLFTIFKLRNVTLSAPFNLIDD